MTYIPVQGGLGNQLFILAMAHYLVEKYNKKVVLTFKTDRFNKGYRDNYLHVFTMNCTHGIQIKDGSLINILLKVLDKINTVSPRISGQIKKAINFVDFSHPLQFRHDKLKSSQIVRGYFQSADLVHEIWESFKEEYQKTVESEFFLLREKIFKEHQISLQKYQCIHVRRGDYLENQDSIGVLRSEYFLNNADTEMLTILTTDTFEDIKFQSEFSEILTFNQRQMNPIQAIAAMTYSSRLILSNSTLSYWGATLALETGAFVIGPEPWFKKNPIIGQEFFRDNRINYRKAIFE
jgi:hypothetical protein